MESTNCIQPLRPVHLALSLDGNTARDSLIVFSLDSSFSLGQRSGEIQCFDG